MPTDWQPIIDDFKAVVPAVDFWSLRLVLDETETLHVREGVVQPPSLTRSRGVHISFIDGDAMAYAATSALTREGLQAACKQAQQWLEASRRHVLVGAGRVPRPERSGSYATKVHTPWEAWGLAEKLELLRRYPHTASRCSHLRLGEQKLALADSCEIISY